VGRRGRRRGDRQGCGRPPPAAPGHLAGPCTRLVISSGHSAAACLAFAILALCVATLARRRGASIAGWLTAGLAVAATAFSRVELGVHWTTDVIASVVFVASWLTAIGIVLGGRLRPDRLAEGQASRE